MNGMDRKKVLFIDRDGVIVEERQVDAYEAIAYIPPQGDFQEDGLSSCDGLQSGWGRNAFFPL